MSELNCPYCNAPNNVNHDDGQGYTEDEAHEMQCRSCDKYFVFYTSISYWYEPRKADCLNGAEHSYQISLTNPKRYSVMICKDCDYRRTPTPEEFAIAGINPNE